MMMCDLCMFLCIFTLLVTLLNFKQLVSVCVVALSDVITIPSYQTDHRHHIGRIGHQDHTLDLCEALLSEGGANVSDALALMCQCNDCNERCYGLLSRVRVLTPAAFQCLLGGLGHSDGSIQLLFARRLAQETPGPRKKQTNANAYRNIQNELDKQVGLGKGFNPNLQLT